VNEKPTSVSSIELFFDLVFVFVITQVTQLVEHAHGAIGFSAALLVLVRSGGCTRLCVADEQCSRDVADAPWC